MHLCCKYLCSDCLISHDQVGFNFTVNPVEMQINLILIVQLALIGRDALKVSMHRGPLSFHLRFQLNVLMKKDVVVLFIYFFVQLVVY